MERAAPSTSPSALALYLASLHDLPSTDERANASLAGVVDSSLEFMHERSQRQRPTVRLVLAGLPQADRHDSLVWLLRAFKVMDFSDATLFHAILLLDRYYACQPCDEEELSGGGCGSQQRLLAAVCCALKTGPQEDLKLSVRQIVTHLSRNSIDFSDVVTTEVAMLQKLDFCIGTTTAHDFGDSLFTRCLNCDHRCKSLADYLLQITLVDVHLHYKYSHAILAAGALSLALFAMRAPADAFAAVLEDLAILFVHGPLPMDELLQCCAEVHELWADNMRHRDRAAEGYLWHLSAKFSEQDRYAVATLAPPDMPPLALPPQYEMQEAMAAVHQGMSSLVASKSVLFPPFLAGDAQDMQLAASWAWGSSAYDTTRQYAAARRPVLGAQITEETWLEKLATALQRPAGRSQELRRLLTQHGWHNDDFSRAPDLDRLFADLSNAAGMPAADPGSDCSASGSTVKVAWGAPGLHPR